MTMQQEPYDRLAGIYDHFQSDVDYDAWIEYIDGLIRRYGKRTGDGTGGRLLVCDLGCGTGIVCRGIHRLGYDVIGIDASEAMLAKSVEQSPSGEILYLRQDITRMELFGTVDVFLCLLDTVNHITRESDLLRLFRSFANYLNPGGLFIFDTATRHHFENNLGNRFFHAVYDEYALLWQNRFAKKSGISTSDIVLFEKTGEKEELYLRRELQIREKYYDPEKVGSMLEASGMQILARFGELTNRMPSPRGRRDFWVAARRLEPDAQTTDKE